ncbi:MAG: hypothetical protein NC181_01705 [Clostridium sp.]|nr:hypothetical protein [Clostridium sp.]MCM1444290.1 hypothetical protein [Candidatus Amulumruptor caecigallinarius]
MKKNINSFNYQYIPKKDFITLSSKTYGILFNYFGDYSVYQIIKMYNKLDEHERTLLDIVGIVLSNNFSKFTYKNELKEFNNILIPKMQELLKEERYSSNQNKDLKDIPSNPYEKLLYLTKVFDIKPILDTFSPVETYIIKLKIGYFKDKHYLENSTKTHFSLEQNDVKKIMDKFWIRFKEMLFDYIDDSIGITKRKVKKK